MNETAVQQLIEHLEENYHLTEETMYEFKQALKAEKDQITEAYNDGVNSAYNVGNAEDYYKKMYEV